MYKPMVTLSDYGSKYKTIKFDRQNGILLMTLHCKDGPYRMGGLQHSELVDAFNNIASDHDNRVVILTGTGDQFCAGIDSDFDVGTGEDVARIHYEGRRIMQACLDVEAPMIAAINGPLDKMPPFALTCDITLCAEHATFSDRVHFAGSGVVPGDGVHVVWQYLLGPNRGRHFLLTGRVLSAQEALNLGVVAEVLPAKSLLPRAWEVARELNTHSHPALRYARLVLNQQYRRLMLDDVALGYGMQWIALKSAMG
jgi:enoyl-CoA hydratase/carnithine racemase